MRLFTAVDPPAEVHRRLQELLDTLRRSARLRWTKPQNLHVTLKFIGEYPEQDLPALAGALCGVRWPGEFEVKVRGLGFFPNERAPRVFWAGVEAGPELRELAGRIDRALVSLGVPAERRAFSPHLTMARIEGRTPLEGLRQAIDRLETVEFGGFRPDRFYLYRSQPGPGGSVYTRIGEYGTTSDVS